MQELKAEQRNQLGKKARAVRMAGFLPAVVYGEGVPSQPVAVPYHDFEKVWREAGESTLLNLNLAGTPYAVLIHDVAYDPLTDRPIHADFYTVRMDKPLRAKIPLEFIGESPAVKNEDGILVKVLQEIEVEALPQDLQHSLQIQLPLLSAIGSRIIARDVALPPGVRLVANGEEIIVVVEAPRSEEELAELASAPGAAEVQEVKTERELKREAGEKIKSSQTASQEENSNA